MFASLGLRAKIMGAFGVLIFMLIAIVVISAFYLNSSDNYFDDYLGLTLESSQVVEIGEISEQMRNTAFRYRAVRDNSLLEGIDQYYPQFRAGVDQLREMTDDEEVLAELDGIGEEITTYVDSLSLGALLYDTALEKYRDEIVPAVDALEQRLIELDKQAAAAGQNEVLSSLIDVQRANLRMVLSYNRYLGTFDDAFVGDISSSFEGVSEQLQRITETFPDRGQAVLDEMASLHEMLLDNVATNREVLLIETEDLDTLGPDIADRLSAVMDVLSERQSALGDEATAKVERGLWIAIIVGVLSVIGAMVISLIMANALLRPIQAMIATLKSVRDRLDFSERAVVSGNDEIADAGNALNSLLDNLQSSIDAVESGCTELAQGNLENRIERELGGDLGRLKTAVNDCSERVAASMGQLANTMDALAAGKFDVEVATDEPGAYGDILQRAKGMAEALHSAMAGIGAVMKKMQAGEFGARVEAELPGDLNSLKQRINLSMEGVENGMNALSWSISALASGDLTKSMNGEFNGQMAELQSDFNASLSQLEQLVKQALTTSGEVETGASEVMSGSQDLSDRTQRQSASLEETAASMEEMTSTVKQSTDNAEQADRLAGEALEQTQSGKSVMERTTDAMTQIRQASDKIEEITSLIDSIAFQTNLLALNAAVEAARAGDQGRGFAVVASEVRSLAQKSADAARDIKGLIDNSSAQIKSGTDLVAQSAESLQDINAVVAKVRGMISEIAAASREQSAGIEQVNQAVTHMDEITQQNAALVEQTSAASESMTHRSKQLNELMGRFTVSGLDTANDASETMAEQAVEAEEAPEDQRPRLAAPGASNARAASRATKEPSVSKPVADDNDDWDEF
jgi:methyl-accepting chemotaxis protein